MSGEKKSWNDRFDDLIERIIAVQITGGDASSLKDEINKMITEQPERLKEKLNDAPKS
jgi:hypothetical protein